MYNRIPLQILFFIFIITNIYSQNNNDVKIKCDNVIYKPNIHTVLLYKEGWELSQPIIQLRSNDLLRLSFDDFDSNVKNYGYTFIHCDANWNPSDILPYEYMDGYQEAQISDYQYSLNTIQEYTHYEIVLPNDDIKLTKSGNYILKVFENFDKNDVVFTKRFMVYEPKVTIDAIVKRATYVDYVNTGQEVDFMINHPQLKILDPFNEIKVVLLQNGRWDNAKRISKPLIVKENMLIYDYEDVNVFTAGNEFLNFDIKNFRYQSEEIREITFELRKHHVYLNNDNSRLFKPYFTVQDINGRRLIKAEQTERNGTEADYAYVHFSLTYPFPIKDGNLYVFGALSDWTTADEFKMSYNYEKKAYEATLYLKQGYYNYEYLYVENGKPVGDDTYIDGSHYETENDYTIYVYYRSFGEKYDKLIGNKTINTQNK